MINWRVRFKNKAFWLGLVPLVLLLIQQVCAIFGVTLDFGVLQEQLLAVVGTVFALLSLHFRRGKWNPLYRQAPQS